MCQKEHTYFLASLALCVQVSEEGRAGLTLWQHVKAVLPDVELS